MPAPSYFTCVLLTLRLIFMPLSMSDHSYPKARSFMSTDRVHVQFNGWVASRNPEAKGELKMLAEQLAHQLNRLEGRRRKHAVVDMHVVYAYNFACTIVILTDCSPMLIRASYHASDCHATIRAFNGFGRRVGTFHVPKRRCWVSAVYACHSYTLMLTSVIGRQREDVDVRVCGATR